MIKLTTDPTTWQLLVIDDKTTTLKLIEAIMLPVGAKVEMIEDPRSAIQLIEEHDVNLILLDIAMPFMNGWDFQQLVRSRSEFDHVAIIGCSALGMYGDRERARELGFEGYITKPFRVDSLLQQIKSCIQTFIEQGATGES